MPNKHNSHRPIIGDKITAVISFLIGTLFSAGLANDWPWGKDVWGGISGIGSLLAGLGTIGLLIFGWIKGNEWMKQERFTRQLDDLNALLEEAGKLQSIYAEISTISPFDIERFKRISAIIPIAQNYIYTCDNQRIEINRRWKLNLKDMDLDELVKNLQEYNFSIFTSQIRQHVEEWKSAIVETTNKLS